MSASVDCGSKTLMLKKYMASLCK